MKIIAFVGSPRKGGNSDRLIDGILAGAAEAGHECEKVYLSDYDLKPIEAVYGREEEWTDSYQTPINALIDRMLAADAVVLGSPVYWFGVSGLLKLFIDRWALYPGQISRLTVGKKMVVALAMADATDEYIEVVLAPLRWSADWLKMKWAGHIVAYGVEDPGDVDKEAELLAQAREIGRGL